MEEPMHAFCGTSVLLINTSIRDSQKLLIGNSWAQKLTDTNWMIIECQNNNVPCSVSFTKQGALLSRIDMDAYDSEPGIADEVQFIWHLDLTDYHRDSVKV